jgi:hypothetical protein
MLLLTCQYLPFYRDGRNDLMGFTAMGFHKEGELRLLLLKGDFFIRRYFLFLQPYQTFTGD